MIIMIRKSRTLEANQQPSRNLGAVHLLLSALGFPVEGGEMRKRLQAIKDRRQLTEEHP